MFSGKFSGLLRSEQEEQGILKGENMEGGLDR